MNVAGRMAARLGWRTDALVIRATFFMHAFIAGSMTTRIADFQSGLGLDAKGLGLALLGQPLGAVAMVLAASRIVDAAGNRAVFMAGLPVMALTSFGLALAPDGWVFFGVFFGYGAAFALINVAINVEADRIEAASGRFVMNSCHGTWSVGFLTASLIGTLARGTGMVPAWHLGLVVPVALAFAMAVNAPMVAAPPRPHAGPARRRVIAAPSARTMLLLGYLFASIYIESASRNWSVIFLRDGFAASALVDTLALPAYIAMMAIGRLMADRLVARFGPARLARTLAVAAGLGLAMVTISPNVAIAIAGFALVGIGICVCFPLTISAAARIGDRPASDNVAATTLLNQAASITASPVIGFAASGLGLRAAYALLIPLVALSFTLAGELGRRPG